eukprot:gene22370-29473_t
MGDAARGGVAMANEPNLVPALYDPQAPAGKRYTELAQTLIPRLLHSTAGLTIMARPAPRGMRIVESSTEEPADSGKVGNHESTTCTTFYGFKGEVDAKYKGPSAKTPKIESKVTLMYCWPTVHEYSLPQK